MLASHLRTVLWLRRRTMLNSLQRQGSFTTVVSLLLITMVLVGAVWIFGASLLVGVAFLSKLSTQQIVSMWAMITLAFCLSWLFGVITDLQRTDSVSMEKLLHLPITLRTALLINYFSSFFSLSIVFFVPAMCGLAIAHVRLGGPRMLVLFPLIFSFLAMITALTFQLRGWLATLMVNKRRRRTILSLLMFTVIAGVQIPNVANIYWQRRSDQTRQKLERQRKQPRENLAKRLAAGEITAEEFQQRIKQHDGDSVRSARRLPAFWTARVLPALKWFPPTWTAHGAGAALEGRVLPGLLETLGACLIALASLSRSYRTTLRFYRGEFSGHRADSTAKKRKPADVVIDKSKPLLVERRLPLVSEPASAVATTTLCSLLRAPEARMALLTTLLMFLIVGGMFFSGSSDEVPTTMRPLMPLGLMLLAAFGIIQISANQFGFDRQGFRLFVMAPIQKRDVLLGKNLALAPLVLFVGVVGLTIAQCLQPMRATHFLATLAQFVTIYLVSCLVSNLISILTPMRVASGAIRKSNPNLITALKQLAFSLLMPLGALPTIIPWGVDAALTASGLNPFRLPVYLLLSMGLAGLTLIVYWKLLGVQGKLLEHQQLNILAVVAQQTD